MSDDLMERFDEVEGTSEESRDEGEAESRNENKSVSKSSTSSSTGSTRSRSQYPMYLSEELQDRLDDRYKKFNARRELNDKEQVEKHKHFLEGLIRSALDSDDFKEYVEEELKR
ncbi:MAG: hypothetical protein SVQ76_01870 [Candidatus Nanohaloarchaea archaeon]|nr:hypothetical protein [Candidatus Nanohaloarchaea archaeon]